ncbi:MAG: polymerase alpha subunit, partial [Burkholderiales bacterium]|nr:polymerase alpha subunit [Burkholderiales bacterium]
TTAVFELESRGMRDLIKRAKPDRFEDVIALVALYRPGPMDLIPEYIERKHGKRVDYLDPRLVPILGPTYGIMVYQEQVMQIAQVIGGYSLGGADLLRRAMGKKKPEEMAQQREIFVAGAEKNGLSRGKATQLFDLMEKFAGYGFNKSHAAAYALLAYQTAYMKAHHAAAFAAANFSAVMDDTDKVRQFHEDAIANGLKVVPPDVNASEFRFVPVDRGTIRYGLGAVRGTGHAAIESIVAARKDGRFTDLFDFCRRVDKRLVNRRVLEALVRAGAFDGIDENRARLLASAGRALEAAEQAERQASQVSLFGEAEAPRGGAHAIVEAPPWDLKQKLTEEKAALGFFLSGHLFSVYERELGAFSRTALAKLAPSESRVWLAGIIASARMQMTRRGRMMVVTLDDGTAQVEITVFNELFERHRDKLKEDALLVLGERRGGREEAAAGARAVPHHRKRRLPGRRFVRQRQRRVRGGARRNLARAPGQQAHLRPRLLARAGERRSGHRDVRREPSLPSAPRRSGARKDSGSASTTGW